jgi:hypothetical protein
MADRDPKDVLLSLIAAIAMDPDPDEIDEEIHRALELVGEQELAKEFKEMDDWHDLASLLHDRGVKSLSDLPEPPEEEEG